MIGWSGDAEFYHHPCSFSYGWPEVGRAVLGHDDARARTVGQHRRQVFLQVPPSVVVEDDDGGGRWTVDGGRWMGGGNFAFTPRFML